MIERADSTDAGTGPRMGWRAKLLGRLKRFRGLIVALAGVGAVLSGLVGYWNVYRSVAVGSPAAVARTGIAMQGSPPSLSLAVMPFVAVGASASDAASADALAQSLTTNLGQVRAFKVAAPGHATNELGKAVDAKRIGRELNVLYLVTGETRPQGDKLGVTLRLVETENATQVWSERLKLAASPTSEQQLNLEGRLARHVVNALYQAAQDRAVKHPELATPIDFVLRGNAAMAGDTWDTRQARVDYDKALQLDPNFVPAIVGRAELLKDEFEWGVANARQKELLAELDAMTARAVALDANQGSAWRMRSWSLAFRGRWGEALAANDKAMALNSWSPRLVSERAGLMSYTGGQTEAESLALRAIAIDPPGSDYQFRQLCQARLLMGRYEEAAHDCERFAGSGKGWVAGQALLIAAYAHMGDTVKAAIARAELLKEQPGTTITNTLLARVSDVPAYRQQIEEHLNPGLRKAGFPER